VEPFDETLFTELRRMTPQQRLELNDRTIAMIEELRLAFAVTDHDPREPRGRSR